jgi:hypothetical protein
MSRCSVLFALCVLVCWLPLSLHGQPPFSALGGAAPFDEHCYRLTSEDSLHQASALWCSVPVEFDDMFDLRFLLYFGCEKSGGEGMAFVMHAAPDSTSFLGCPDNALGYAPLVASSCPVPQPSLSVEIDTRCDGQGLPWEMAGDHLALCRNGFFGSPLLPPAQLSAAGGGIRDCAYHSFRIAWKPSENILRVWFDDELKISYPTQLGKDFFAGHRRAWFGFTASTGKFASTQMLCVRSITLEIDQEARDKRHFQDGVFVLPMPDEDKIGFDFDFVKSQNVQIKLYSPSGSLLRTESLKGVTKLGHQLSVQGLPSGVYYVSVTNGGQQRVTRKILYIAQPKT